MGLKAGIWARGDKIGKGFKEMRWCKVGESSKVGFRTNKGYDVRPENSLKRWKCTRPLCKRYEAGKMQEAASLEK